MKKFLYKKLLIISVSSFIILISFTMLYSYQNGITGRTLKTSNSGCGGCHGSSATSGVTVTISGPDTVNTSQMVNFSLTIAYATQPGAGLDVATRSGTLGVVTSGTHISNGELTHNNNINMTNGSVTIQFSYTAPASATIDTIWATGNATNENGGTGGDFWNWAPSKRVVIRNPLGIEKNIIPVHFSLNQNFPNPFNPVTTISFNLSQESFVSLKIFDIQGNEVQLAKGQLPEGFHSYIWNASNNSSGVYFYELNVNGQEISKKMVLSK